MRKQTRITALTKAQRARMPEWAQKWIEIGLSTKPVDRARAEAAMRECYAAAKLNAPNGVVWVASPLIGALAFPIAAGVVAALEKEGLTGKPLIDSAVGSAVHSAVDSAVDSAVGSAVHSAVDSAVHSAVRSAVHSAVRSAVHSAVDSAVDSAVGSAVDSAVGSAVGSAVRSAVGDLLSSMWNLLIGGRLWSGWWWGPTYATFFLDVCGLELSPELERAARANEAQAKECSWWWPHRDFVMACETPHTLERDSAGRLHCETGPAIAWDTFPLYFVHGVRVPGDIIEHPESITVERIEAEQNAEVRRIMVDRYGMSRYVRDAKFEVVDADKDPLGQPRRLLRRDGLLVVELTNSTEDADRTRRVYHVPCHPELRPWGPTGEWDGRPQKLTALNAVASTYGMTGAEYARMQVET